MFFPLLTLASMSVNCRLLFPENYKRGSLFDIPKWAGDLESNISHCIYQGIIILSGGPIISSVQA